MRDDFPKAVKEQIAKRVGLRCSNPSCRRPTAGPEAEGSGTVSIGVAAHITGASPGGPRYDDGLTAAERMGAANGVWLCENCAKLIDADALTHPPELLTGWKDVAEAMAALELRGFEGVPSRKRRMRELEREMPKLFAEMRKDLKDHPHFREFVLLSRHWSYNANGLYIAYCFEEHEHLLDMIRVLENNGLVRDITSKNVDRFRLNEEFVSYLKESQPA